MGKRRSAVALSTAQSAAVGSAEARHGRGPRSLQSFAFLACVTFVLAAAIDPTAAFALTREPEQVAAPGPNLEPNQTVTAGETVLSIERGQYGVTKLQIAAPAVGKPDPGTAKAIAYEMVLARGWDEAQYACLVSLWNRESHWNVYAENKKSGAYGIPQALPGTKMATVGADWQTNPATQITWGLNYIGGRYGSPCGAWAHHESAGWY